MKTTGFIFAVLLFATTITNAQWSGGLKINLGTGGIHSSNLENNLNFQNNFDAKITSWTIDQHNGFVFGFGGFAAYSFSERFSLLTEPGIHFLKCGIDFTRQENDVDINGNGTIKTETTESDITLTYFSLPFLARYEFASKFYLLGGLGINFTGAPGIISTAFSQKDEYKNGALDKTTIDPRYALDTRLNVFDSPRFDFVFGIGKSFEVSGKALNIDIRYNLPLTNSEMFTTDSYYNDGHFKHNNFLGLDGKYDAEKNAPYLLNDFKMSVLNVSIALTLFKK